MAPQTSYSINLPAVAFPGQPVDLGVKDDVTALASGAIGYGKLVVRSSAASFDKVIGVLPSASADITTLGKPLGVSVADQGRAQDPSVVEAVFPDKSAVSCRRIGRIWVKVEEAVTAGDQAFVRFADGTVTGNNGGFRKSADTATAVALPHAYYESSALANGFAVLQLTLD